MSAPFQPNTTCYLCAGTGMDMNNSIWWHRFAYPNEKTANKDSWWGTCFAFFKAHAIANGHWYLSTIDVAKGYVQLGRTPLNNGSIPKGQSGLGSASKQEQMDDGNFPFAEAIRAVDYLIFANDGLPGSGFNADIQYAFVTGIEEVNWNVARIHFTIDAIMTYQKFFALGKCLVDQDMQFQERKDSESGPPNLDNLNREAPLFDHSEDSFIFQQLLDNDLTEYFGLGRYKNCFVTSDIALNAEKIQPNEAWGGIPSFEMANFSYIGDTNLGIGLYAVPARINNAFNTLGSFNAMEHVLYTYLVPEKLCNNYPISGEPVHITNTQDYINPDYKGTKNVEAHVPVVFDDAPITTPTNTSGYKPLNLKMYEAPYVYYNIVDNQGGCITIQPQLMTERALFEPSEAHYWDPVVAIDASIAPNTLSALIMLNYDGFHYTTQSPFLSLWQMPSYSMTPNNSGYNDTLVTALYSQYAGRQLTRENYGGAMVTSIAQVVTGKMGGLAGVLLAPESGIIGYAVGSGVGGALSAALSPVRQQYEAGLGQGTSLKNEAKIARHRAESQKQFGLPQAVGGLPQGYTSININGAQYRFYICHLRTELMKFYDLYMSVYGYPQNKFRYPHINIRKRWCYVRLSSVNMIPLAANEYISAGVPSEMANQIVERLTAGVTFWNVRHALMGDGDSGESDVRSYDDSRIAAIKNCQFIRNYGGTPDCDIMKENMSFTGGYANDYSDDYELNPQKG